MQIGLYSPRQELLDRQIKAIDDFNQTACLDLTVHAYSDHRALEQAATNIPIDILSYDVDEGDEVRERMERIAHTLPNCRLLLLSESEKHAVFGYSIRAAGFRDYQSLLDLNTSFLRCHKSYMVNLEYVEKWEMERFTLADGGEVNISRPYRQMARSVYACHVAQTEDTLAHEQKTKKSEPAGRMGGPRR